MEGEAESNKDTGEPPEDGREQSTVERRRQAETGAGLTITNLGRPSHP